MQTYKGHHILKIMLKFQIFDSDISNYNSTLLSDLQISELANILSNFHTLSSKTAPSFTHKLKA